MRQQQTVKQIRFRVGGNRRWTYKTLGEALNRAHKAFMRDRSVLAIELIETTTKKGHK